MLYDWIKALHVIAVISWMAGMLYLPRLFVYHASAKAGSELSETLKVMERRLLRFIINPAMIMSFAFGIWMISLNPNLLQARFMDVKLAFVLIMTGVHGLLAKYRKDFSTDSNQHSAKFFRVMNEFPTLLMIGIVILVIVKPTL